MNKELKEILSNEVCELDLVKSYLSFCGFKYNSFVINWHLCNNTMKELEKIGVSATVGTDYAGDYTTIRW